MPNPGADFSTCEHFGASLGMNIVLRVDAVLAGAAFRAGTTLAVAPTLQHLAHALIAAGAAVPAAADCA